ncbi:MAG: hypothetical protein LIP01_05435 [Tannerellaceae bacterium]|nr:hypothetical protein [Tannerellaceae bacterium]
MAENPDSEAIFIDCGKTPLGEENFNKWVEFMATSSYYSGKDNNQAFTYNNYAKSILQTWRTNIKQGQYVLYTKKLSLREQYQQPGCLMGRTEKHQ